MADTVNSIGSGGTAVTPVVAPVPPVVPQEVKSPDQADKPTVRSNVYSDPLAGAVVTQMVDNEGNIVQQNPASSVISYLRAGLTAEGFPRPTQFQQNA